MSSEWSRRRDAEEQRTGGGALLELKFLVSLQAVDEFCQVGLAGIVAESSQAERAGAQV